ncbi:hypothetical protein WJX84_003205 [Apatococcus fuscideae]|uniref:Uncharacterized protein n=1 Tax=Apatococcus fuscideae TaxID=2026836 RepID=A0AAW1SV58_9CHLO
MASGAVTRRVARALSGGRSVMYFPGLETRLPAAVKGNEAKPEERIHDAYAHQPDAMGHSIAGPRSDYFPATVHVPEGMDINPAHASCSRLIRA